MAQVGNSADFPRRVSMVEVGDCQQLTGEVAIVLADGAPEGTGRPRQEGVGGT